MCGCHYGMFTVATFAREVWEEVVVILTEEKLVVKTTEKQILTSSNENVEETLFPVKIDTNS